MYSRHEPRGGLRSRGMRHHASNHSPRHKFQGNRDFQRNPISFGQNIQHRHPQGVNSNPNFPYQNRSMERIISVPRGRTSHVPSTSSSPLLSGGVSASIQYPNNLGWPQEQNESRSWGPTSGIQQFLMPQSQEIHANNSTRMSESSQFQNNQNIDSSEGNNFFLNVQKGIQSYTSKSDVKIPGLDVLNSQEDNTAQPDKSVVNFVTNIQQPPPTFAGVTCMQGLTSSNNSQYVSTSGNQHTFMNQIHQHQHGTPQFLSQPPIFMPPQNQHYQQQNSIIHPPHVPPSSYLNSDVKPPQSSVSNKFWHLPQFDQQKEHQSPCHYQQPTHGSSSENVEISRKEKDLQWIVDWLKCKKVEKKHDVSTSSSSVSDVQEKVKRMMFLMASLQKQIKVISSCDQDQYEDEMKATNKIREEMNSIRKHLTVIDTAELQMKIKMRKEKRERLKRQKQRRYEAKQKGMEHRDQLHRQIDGRLKLLHDREKEKIQQKELKKNADVILCEVRKKTQDVTRSIDLLKNLSKLRKLRKDRLNNQGVLTKAECDVEFTDKVDVCLDTLKMQKQVYDAENKALRVMMETEREENKEKERFQLQNKENKQRKKVDRMLFGEDEPLNPGDPMFLFRQYYDQASLNVDTLIQIRGDWDRFIVPEGTPCASRIPDGFVLPTDPCSEVWASRLKDT